MNAHLDAVRKLCAVHRFAYYIGERWRIRNERITCAPRERWTVDPILGTYRFNNVRRMWDYTSEWLIGNWYMPFKQHRYAGFAAVLGRCIGYAPTLYDIGFVHPLDPHEWLKRAEYVTTRRVKRGLQVFTYAYRAQGWNSRTHQRRDIWLMRDVLRPLFLSGLLSQPSKSAAGFHDELQQFTRWDDEFTQLVVMDLMHTPILRYAVDRDTYGYAGSLAMKALNRIHGRLHVARPSRTTLRDEMFQLRHQLDTQSLLPSELRGVLSIDDIAFNLRNFYRYEQLLNKEIEQGVPFEPRLV